MEKGDLPVILVEALWELLEVGLDLFRDVRWRYQWSLLIGILFHQNLLENRRDGLVARPRLVLLHTSHVDHEDHTLFKAILECFFALHIFALRRGRILTRAFGSEVRMDFLEKESQNERAYFCDFTLVFLVELILGGLGSPQFTH